MPQKVLELKDIEDQESRLIFKTFDEATALALGMRLVQSCQAQNLPVVINIRNTDRTFFHAALAGSAPLNDNWARRKSNVTFMFHKSSFWVATHFAEKGRDLVQDGLDTADYAAAGGSFPIRVRGVGVVAAVTISGLPQAQDHAVVVRALEEHLADI
ncbi:MAG: heme-degrading domain-containing protein [Microgenomates group bacterium]